MEARSVANDLLGMSRSVALIDIDSLHDDSTLTTAQVAAWLQVSEHWVREHASGRRRPHLPSEKLGKYVRYRWGTLKLWRKSLGRRG